MKFKHSGKTLEIDGKPYTFKQDIEQVLQRGEDRVIVNLDGSQFAPNDPNVGRNIFSLDRQGHEVWRIGASGFTYTTDDGRKVPLSWLNIYFRENGRSMRVGDHAGFEWKLDPDTGELSDPEFMK